VQHAERAKRWLNSEHVKAKIGEFAQSVKTQIKDPEVVKSYLGSAVNAGIGHYVYTHDNIDSEIVAHAVQHVGMGLRISASQARDVLGRLTSTLRSAAAGAHDSVVRALGAFQRGLRSLKFGRA
jgi:nucleoid DNA-binding protein